MGQGQVTGSHKPWRAGSRVSPRSMTNSQKVVMHRKKMFGCRHKVTSTTPRKKYLEYMIKRKKQKSNKNTSYTKIGNLTSYALKLHDKPNISHNSSINRDVHLEKITKNYKCTSD